MLVSMNEHGARLARLVPATVVVAFVVVGVAFHGVDGLRVAAGAVAVLAMIAFRPARPAWQLIAAAAVSTVAVAVVCADSSSSPGWFASVTVVGWMAWIAGPAVWITEFAVAIAVLIVEAVRVPDHGWLPWLAGTTFAVVACITAQHQRRLAEQLRAAQGGLAERARAEERNRIAHEIHDAVAHALTVSVLHISSARLALDDDLDEARRLMAEAEEQGRLALTEVRQAVGMLRQDGPVADLLPHTGQIAHLVDTVRSAGATVELETSGPVERLPNTTGFVLYRILQEALTNSVRHAPGAATRCSVTVDPTQVELTVDTLRRASVTAAGTGTGLAGMRARAETLGGTCSAGPHEDTWRVRAVLPLHALSTP
jgi:signal transduction histidine kinase